MVVMYEYNTLNYVFKKSTTIESCTEVPLGNQKIVNVLPVRILHGEVLGSNQKLLFIRYFR